MTKDKFHFFSIIAEARYTVETFSFVITVPVLIMTRPPGEVTPCVGRDVGVENWLKNPDALAFPT